MTESLRTAESWANTLLVQIDKKMRKVSQRNFGKMPYMATNGIYDDMANNRVHWWTNGFFAGELWQLYHATGWDEYRQNAEKIEEELDPNFVNFTKLHHDVGFMWLHTAVADYRLTDHSFSRVRGLHAATILAGRFNVNGRFIRAWDESDNLGWAIIDSMMNINLLYWASETTQDPRFREIAMAHADRLLEVLVRPDGSVGHIASFDPETGSFIKQLAGQGYSDSSAWSRGQAWAIYGYALSYYHTKEVRYLDAAKRVAQYFITNVSQTNYLSVSDFKAPLKDQKYDASAGTAAAAGMLLMADFINDDEKYIYQSAAIKILQATTDKWLNLDPEQDGLVDGSSQSYHRLAETEVPIIYGDYFFIEAILHLCHKDFLIW